MPDPVYDVIVLLPGIMGSTLRQHNKMVWAPTVGAAARAVGTFGQSVKALTLPDGLGDDAPSDTAEGGGVVPVALFPDIHVIPGFWTAHLGYGKLQAWLQDYFGLTRVTRDGPLGNFLPFPYDWRLSIRYNGRRLAEEAGTVLERWRAQQGRYAEARLIFIAHSMGGLVARWAIDREGLAADTHRLITLATPHRGSFMAVDRLVNGVRVGWGPLTLLSLTAFARSLPGLYHLLPEYACLQDAAGLKKVTELDLPELARTRVADAMRLHDELDESGAGKYRFYPLAGAKQQTPTTGRITGRKVTLDPMISGRDEQGDGTVPRLAATPRWLEPESEIVHYATDKHGALQSNSHVLDTLEQILTSTAIVHRGPGDPNLTHVDLRVPEVCPVGAAIDVHAVITGGVPRPASAVLLREDDSVVQRKPLSPADDGMRARFAGQPEGLYSVSVEPGPSARGRMTVVTAPFIVRDTEEP
jgi:pimeloyl-ACP methyl ester carboxylesterase